MGLALLLCNARYLPNRNDYQCTIPKQGKEISKLIFTAIWQIWATLSMEACGW